MGMSKKVCKVCGFSVTKRFSCMCGIGKPKLQSVVRKHERDEFSSVFTRRTPEECEGNENPSDRHDREFDRATEAPMYDGRGSLFER